jgi:hypothetical protein
MFALLRGRRLFSSHFAYGSGGAAAPYTPQEMVQILAIQLVVGSACLWLCWDEATFFQMRQL